MATAHDALDCSQTKAWIDPTPLFLEIEGGDHGRNYDDSTRVVGITYGDSLYVSKTHPPPHKVKQAQGHGTGMPKASVFGIPAKNMWFWKASI
jgi:hypothetical protein